MNIKTVDDELIKAKTSKDPLLILVILGMAFAIAGEIFDNLIVNHRSSIIFAVILPIYILFFTVAYSAYQKLKYSYLLFTIIFGIFSWIIIENIILKKFIEPWPIQIFMLSYWISIISYPFVLVNKRYRSFIISLLIASVTSVLSYVLKDNVFLSLAIFQFCFWIASAISNLIEIRKLS